MKFLSEHNLFIFLVQFALLLGMSKLMGLLFEKFKQPAITGEVLVGLILGPALFGKYFPEWQVWLFPKETLQISMLETIAWLGQFYLLMETGLDINFGKIWKQKGQALTIALTDLIVPVILAFIPIYLIHESFLIDPSRRIIFTLFVSTIMTISALTVAIRAMYDLNILKSDTGFLIVSALTINDLIGWVVFTIILGIFMRSEIDFITVTKLIVYTLGFTIISLSLMRKYVDKAMTFIHNKFGADTGLKTTFVFITGMIFGAITLQIGIHSLFGFFIAGIVLGEAKHFSENDRFVMNRLVHSLFVPVFFANIGLHLDFVASFNWQLVLLFTFLGIGVRYIGAYMGAILAKQNKSNLQTIAICHTAGGEMHIVVAILAFSYGLLSREIFVGIMVASILTTIIFGPWLAHALKQKRKGLLSVVFGADSVMLDANFSDKQELIEHMSGVIAQKAYLIKETVLDEIALREEQMSTSIGKGVAFPHARLKGLTHPLIYIVRNKQGLEWNSPDNKPVHWAIFIITPQDNPNAQLHILQTISKTLSDKILMEKINKSDNPQSVWNYFSANLENCEECTIPV